MTSPGACSIRTVEACGYRLRLDERDRHDEALLARTTATEREALATEERERIERLQAEAVADRALGDLVDPEP
ncbi:hypothetical protein [Geodermatophilus sp. CPCC 206100]|uniref:hypothetical protein n=1 Tax=Geodermatophilus sp. CPCC 206100 TaxID=3020054 RepID=UPI003AFFAB03